MTYQLGGKKTVISDPDGQVRLFHLRISRLFVILPTLQVAAIREALSEEEVDEGKKEEVREEGA